MKYKVKFRCYWYNTGQSDNHYYTNYEIFDTIDEAQKFKEKVDNRDYQDIEIENGFIDGVATIVKYYPEREEPI